MANTYKPPGWKVAVASVVAIAAIILWEVGILTSWDSYRDAKESCQYEVEAEIVSNEPSAKYWDTCSMSVKYTSPRPNDARTFLYDMELPGKACASGNGQEDPQLGGPGVGKLVVGCVRDREPQHFLSAAEGNAPEDFASLHVISSKFVWALVVTIPGVITLIGILVWAHRIVMPYGIAVQEELKAKMFNQDKQVCLICGSHATAPKEQVRNAAEGKDREDELLLEGAALRSAHHC